MERLKESTKVGLSFGTTSAVITTLGLFIGLSSATGNRVIAISGIITIAIADAFSDALGIHLSEESDKRNSKKHIWRATSFTFATKLIIALTFLIPVLLFNLQTAIIISIVYGLTIISIFSYYIAKSRKESPIRTIVEHNVIAIVVIIITKFIGETISTYI